MKFETLINQFRAHPYFELREVLAMSDDQPGSLKNQISGWVRAGKLVRLRRGKYLLAQPYRMRTPSVYYVSNCLLRPSYVSLQTALQYYGMIPEAVAVVQAVSPKHGRDWENQLGVFDYRCIKQERFWGYQECSRGQETSAQDRFLIALPEKALIDLFYLQPHEWTEARHRQMRFQNVDLVDGDRLRRFARRFDSPKVLTACQRFLTLTKENL
jgi:predicted transcriptional regulator of viral defense system